MCSRLQPHVYRLQPLVLQVAEANGGAADAAAGGAGGAGDATVATTTACFIVMDLVQDKLKLLDYEIGLLRPHGTQGSRRRPGSLAVPRLAVQPCRAAQGRSGPLRAQ